MSILLLLLLLAAPSFAAEPPFYIKGVDSASDARGVNENDRALADAIRKSATDIRALQSGASLTANQTWTGANTYASSVTFQGYVAGIYNIVCASGTTDSASTGSTAVGLPGSTITIRTQAGSRIRVQLAARGNTSTSGHMSVHLLQNGQLAPGNGAMTVADGDYGMFGGIIGNQIPAFMGGVYISSATSVGDYVFSIMYQGESTGTEYITGTPPWSFCAEELR